MGEKRRGFFADVKDSEGRVIGRKVRSPLSPYSKVDDTASRLVEKMGEAEGIIKKHNSRLSSIEEFHRGELKKELKEIAEEVAEITLDLEVFNNIEENIDKVREKMLRIADISKLL